MATHLELEGNVLLIAGIKSERVEDALREAVEVSNVVGGTRPDLDAVDLGASRDDKSTDLVLGIDHLANQGHGEVRPYRVEQLDVADKHDPLATVLVRRVLPHLQCELVAKDLNSRDGCHP